MQRDRVREKSLRVIPHGKQRLTVYRARQVGVNLGSEKIANVTRRAFLAVRVIQRQRKFDSKGLVNKWCK